MKAALYFSQCFRPVAKRIELLPADNGGRQGIQRLVPTTFVAPVDKARERDQEIKDEQELNEMGMRFLECARHRYAEEFYRLLNSGAPVNFQEPRTLLTALHYTSSRNAANQMTYSLIAHPDIDLLARDHYGRQAWNIAIYYDIDPIVLDDLYEASLAQAQAQGIDLDGEYLDQLKRWITQDWYAAVPLLRGGPEFDNE